MNLKTKQPHQFEISMKITMDGQPIIIENYLFNTEEGKQKIAIQEFINRFIQPFTEAEQKRVARKKRQDLNDKFKDNELL